MASVFPLASPAPTTDRHPASCACGRCTDELMAVLARPLVQPAPARTDQQGGAR